MFVQDLVSSGLNITAEVSREEAYNFQEMCQMFSRAQKHSTINRIPKCQTSINIVQKTLSQTSLNKLNGSKSIVNRSNQTKTMTTVPIPVKKVTTKRIMTKPSVLLETAIKDGTVFDAISIELAKFSKHSDVQFRNESRILGILKQHFKIFDRTLALIPFGSRTFGFGRTNSNYNILIDTRKIFFFCVLIYEIFYLIVVFVSYKLTFYVVFEGKSKFSEMSILESFEKYLTSTNIQQYFDGIAEIPASRTLKQQLRMIHKESGICVLLVADEIAISNIPKIIRDVIAVKPICMFFFERIYISPKHFIGLMIFFFKL